jgi:hypothetical protein
MNSEVEVVDLNRHKPQHTPCQINQKKYHFASIQQPGLEPCIWISRTGSLLFLLQGQARVIERTTQVAAPADQQVYCKQ